MESSKQCGDRKSARVTQSSADEPFETSRKTEFIFETPPKTRPSSNSSSDRRRLQRLQDVENVINYGQWLDHHNISSPGSSFDRVHESNLTGVDAAAAAPALATSPAAASESSLAFKHRLMMNMTPTSDLSSRPSWHTDVDGPLSPGLANAVVVVQPPKTPVQKHIRKPTAFTPTPLLASGKIVRMGKTWKKWKTCSKRKNHQSQQVYAGKISPQPRTLRFSSPKQESQSLCV